MKRYFFTLILSIVLCFNGWSQITEAEYFIDSDPGIGNATNLDLTPGNSINNSFGIPTSGLSNGLHVLHIRVKGSNNIWSMYYRDYFYIHTIELPTTGSNLSAAEYFIDSDPGVNNATAIPITSGQILNNTFTIPTSGLSNGLHVLHIRVKDLDGTWSLFYRDYFYIHTVLNLTSVPIVEAEYFFDTDPGIGNGAAIALTEGFSIAENFTIPIPVDMTNGTHYLYIRVKNEDNIWSTYISAPFNVDSSLTVEDLNSKDFKVFPNPTNTFLNIQINTDLEYTVQVFDSSGKKLTQAIISHTHQKLDFSAYPKGMYILQITEKQSNKNTRIKIIKS